MKKIISIILLLVLLCGFKEVNMALNANRTSDDFTFKHSGQPDEYGVSVGDFTEVQEKFDSRAIDNLGDINNIKSTMRSTTNGDSGADNIGATPYDDITGDTVQEQLKQQNDKINNQLPVPNDSITDAKLKQSGNNILPNFNTHLADNRQLYINVMYPPSGLTAAVGDGATNDTASIQAVIDWVATNGGGIVYFPKKTFIITDLRIKSNVTLMGGGNSSILKLKSACALGDRLSNDGSGLNYDGIPMIYNSYNDNLVNIAIKNLYINGNYTQQVVGGAKQVWGIYLNKVDGLIIENVKVYGCLSHGIALKEAINYTVKKCIAESNGADILLPETSPVGGDGFVALSMNDNGVFEDCIAINNRSIGFESEGRFDGVMTGKRNKAIKFVRCLSTGNYDHDFLLLFSDDVVITDCTSRNCHTNGLNIVGCNNVKVDGIDIDNPTNHGIWIRPETMGADGTNYKIHIQRAVLRTIHEKGIVIQDAHDVSIQANIAGIGGGRAVSIDATPQSDNIKLKIIYDGSIGLKADYGIYAANPKELIVEDSVVNACNVYGIWFDASGGSVESCILRNSVSKNNGTRGFHVSGTQAGSCKMTGCNFYGNVTADYAGLNWNYWKVFDKMANFPAMAAADVLNNAIFVDSADNKLKFKDSGGTVNLLY